MPAGSELNEGLGRAKVQEPLRTRSASGFGEEWLWPNQESSDTDAKGGTRISVPAMGRPRWNGQARRRYWVAAGRKEQDRWMMLTVLESDPGETEAKFSKGSAPRHLAKSVC